MSDNYGKLRFQFWFSLLNFRDILQIYLMCINLIHISFIIHKRTLNTLPLMALSDGDKQQTQTKTGCNSVSRFSKLLLRVYILYTDLVLSPNTFTYLHAIHSYKINLLNFVLIGALDPVLNEYPSFPTRFRKNWVSKNNQENSLFHQSQATFDGYDVLLGKMFGEQISYRSAFTDGNTWKELLAV